MQPPETDTLPSLPELVRVLREASTAALPEHVRNLLDTAAQIISDLDPAVDLSERLTSKDDEQRFLSRIEATMPNFMSPQQITMLNCFIMDRYGLDLPAVRAVLAASHNFMSARAALRTMGADDVSSQTRH